MSEILEILNTLGYQPTLSNNYYRCRAVYRDGNGTNTLSINKDTGRFRDFASGITGNWNDFLQLALDGNEELVKQYSTGDYTFTPEPQKPKIVQIKRYDLSMLEKLIPFYDFYHERGISTETLQKFGCGLATSGKLRQRIVFPCFGQTKNDLLGFAGRQIKEDKTYPKWLIFGGKTNFLFPLHLPDVRQAIKQARSVILVESVGDILSLYDAGVKNIACTFGLSLSKGLIKEFISLNVSHIQIALNNDAEKEENWGQEGAARIRASASKFFDNVTEIQPPNNKNDWGECDKQEIREYFKL